MQPNLWTKWFHKLSALWLECWGDILPAVFTPFWSLVPLFLTALYEAMMIISYKYKSESVSLFQFKYFK